MCDSLYLVLQSDRLGSEVIGNTFVVYNWSSWLSLGRSNFFYFYSEDVTFSSDFGFLIFI